MNNKIKELCRQVYPEAVKLRRLLHQNPELGRREFETTKVIKAYLEELDISVSTPFETGVVADIRGEKEGGIVALRADIDALPINEKCDCDFKSANAGLRTRYAHGGTFGRCKGSYYA